MLPQDLHETLLPAVDGDNLDAPEANKPKETEHVVLASSPVIGSEGLNLIQKLTFFGIIVGIVAMYFKLRSRETAPMEKFPA